MAPLTLYWNPFFHIISCKATAWQDHWIYSKLFALFNIITNITVSLAEVLVFYQLTDSEFYLVKLWKRLLHFQLQSTCTSQIKKYGERFEPRGHFIRWDMIFRSSVVLNRAVADGMMLLTTCALVIFTVKISCITSVDLWYYWASVMT